MLTNCSKKVLVAEDEETRNLCSDVLSAAGYMVETCQAGIEAFRRIRDTRFDLVIADAGVLELYDYSLKYRDSLKCKFLLITSGNDPDAEQEIAEAGLKRLIKPFKIKDLLKTVDNMMAGPLANSRLELEMECDLVEENAFYKKILPACTRNVTRNGAEVRFDSRPFAEGARISVSLRLNNIELRRKALVKWSRPSGGQSAAGLKFDEPLPASLLINLIENDELRQYAN